MEKKDSEYLHKNEKNGAMAEKFLMAEEYVKNFRIQRLMKLLSHEKYMTLVKRK